MRQRIVAVLVALLAGLGIATAAPAMAAGGYVLNDSSHYVRVVSNQGVSSYVGPGQSSSLYMLDADKIYVSIGYCIDIDGRRIGFAAGTYIAVPNGALRHVTRYAPC